MLLFTLMATGNIDISQMSDEEQLQAALALSLEVSGASAAPATAAPAGLPDRGAARSFPGKDSEDTAPMKKQRQSEPKEDMIGSELQLADSEIDALVKLVFGDRPEAVDVTRWFSVGFEFSDKTGTEWGLWQKQGGPCGVFAPVQAFILKQMLFEGGSTSEEVDHQQPMALNPGGMEDSRNSVLATALATVLFHAAQTSSYVVCQVEPRSGGAEADMEVVATAVCSGASASSALTIRGRRVSRAADAQRLFEEGVSSWLAGSFGVLSFVCSILLSRSPETVLEDMDDPSSPLIGRFGHCSQELVNLMLIGEATANVFDGSRWLGDDPSSGFLVKGIDGERIGTPPIGFLSEMEPMRYLQVGTLYKHPEYPVWVLGSPTHYTLVFSTHKEDSQLSKEAQVEQKAKKVFVDNALDEGLAMSSNLGKMIEGLGLGADRISQAQSQLVNEDIVLWEDFKAWTLKQYGLGDRSGGEVFKTVRLFLYDGQDPPGPSLKSVVLELSDIDPRHAGGGSEGDTFAATLQTRWPNAIVEVKAVAVAGAGS